MLKVDKAIASKSAGLRVLNHNDFFNFAKTFKHITNFVLCCANVQIENPQNSRWLLCDTTKWKKDYFINEFIITEII